MTKKRVVDTKPEQTDGATFEAWRVKAQIDLGLESLISQAAEICESKDEFISFLQGWRDTLNARLLLRRTRKVMTTKMTKNPRDFWMPRHKETKEQCASCPFGEDNNEEWSEIVKKLCSAAGQPFSPLVALVARTRIQEEAESNGEFSCHCSVYNDDMSRRDPSEHRQCPGATKYYREAGVKLIEKVKK